MNCNRLPNKRFQPTASLAALASRRLKRMPLGGTVIEAENAMASSQSKKLTRRDFIKLLGGNADCLLVEGLKYGIGQ
jgi:hypothetical protein